MLARVAAGDATGRTKVFRQLGAIYFAVSAVVIIALSAELWLVIRLRAGQGAAEEWRKHHASVYDVRFLVEAYPESVWDVQWESYRPGARVEEEIEGQQYVVAINSHGFRTREFDTRKPAGTTRVVCIGGSTTVEGRTNDETYPALLERLLAARHPDHELEVLNLGISGTNSSYWLSRLDRLFAFEPDVIVQYEGMGDVFWQLAEVDDWRLRILYRSLLLQHVVPLAPPLLEPRLQAAASNVGVLGRDCRERGAAHLVGTFSVPDPARLTREMRVYLEANLMEMGSPADVKLADYGTYAELIARYNRHLDVQARAVGSGLVPVANRLTDPALYVDICHKTPEGIARLAEAFLPEVEAMLVGRWSKTPRRAPSPSKESR